MGIFSMFKKKESDPLADLEGLSKQQDALSNQDPLASGTEEQGFSGEGLPKFDSFGNQTKPRDFEQPTHQFQPQMQQQQFGGGSQDLSKDMQLILAKLDTLRAEVANMNQRLENMERQQTKRYQW